MFCHVLDPEGKIILVPLESSLCTPIDIGNDSRIGSYLFEPSSIAFPKEGLYKVIIKYGCDQSWSQPFSVRLGT